MPSVSAAPSASSKRARLRGQALRDWYAQNSDLTPQQWEAEQRRLEEERRGPARLFLFIAFPILMLLAPISGTLVTTILAIWLVIGSGNFWWRVTLTMGAIFLMGCWSAFFAAMLLWTLFLATSFAYVWSTLFPRFYLMPTRPVQFSLWQIGGCTIVYAAAMALLRTAGFSLQTFDELESRQLFFLQSPVVVVNVVVASLPVLVPARYRSVKLFGLSAFMVLFVLPMMEVMVAIYLFDSVSSRDELLFINLAICASHIAGALIVWMMVYTMEGALAFCDAKPPDLQPIETEADPLGTSYTVGLPDEG